MTVVKLTHPGTDVVVSCRPDRVDMYVSQGWVVVPPAK